MMVEDVTGGGLHLLSYKQKPNGTSVSWGGSVDASEAASPALVRRFLAETLYRHLHPRKAATAVGAFGQVCTDAELAAFIRQHRRKVATPQGSARRLGVE